MNQEWLAIVRQRFQADGWAARAASVPPLFVWNFSPGRVEVPGWTCNRVRRIPTSNELVALGADVAERAGEWRVTTPVISQALWQSPARPGVLLKADLFECGSRDQAADLLLRLLGEFESPLMTQKSGTPGDVAFGGRGEGLFLFARGNVACLCRNVNRELTSVMPIATALDQVVSGQSAKARRQRIAAEPRAYEGDGRPEEVEVTLLESAHERGADRQMRRFVAPAGDILLRGDTIIYRGPAASAGQLEVEEGL